MNDEKDKNMIIFEVFLAHFIKHKLRIFEEWYYDDVRDVI